MLSPRWGQMAIYFHFRINSRKYSIAKTEKELRGICLSSWYTVYFGVRLSICLLYTCMWNSHVLWTNPRLRIFLTLDICSFLNIYRCLKHSQQVFRPYNYSSTKMMENYFVSVSDSLLGFEVFCKYLCGKFGFALIRLCLLRKLYIWI